MISVVLSVYNTGKYLSKAMEALMNQTFTDFEIIIVDDGSTDGSDKICEQEKENRKQVRVFHKSNGGLSSARNFGIEHANGQYIIFPDPDDWVEPNYLEKLVEISKKADLAICGHFDEMDGKTRIWNREAKPCILDNEMAMEVLMMPSQYCGYAWNKLYNLSVIKDNNLRFDTELGMVQDLHFAVRYFQLIKTVAYDPIPLYHYNHDSGGVTASYTPLTPRKISGLLTYKKIGEMTEKNYPNVAKLAYSSLCNMSLQDIYIYHRSAMNDKVVLKKLISIVKEYKSCYRKSNAYTRFDKMFMNVATFNTGLYTFLTRIKKALYNRLNKNRKSEWKTL